MLRASLYVRLSRAAGAENVSRDGMIADLRALCDRQGFAETALYVDDGKSGAVRNRPEFLAWIADAREGRADVLATWHADRLSREGLNVAAMLLDVHEGKDQATGKVVFPQVRLMDVNGLDSNDGETFRLRFVIQAEVARAERERIRARTQAAKVRLSAAHRFAGGPPPYGYRSAANPNGPGRVLEVDPDEAAFIRMAADSIFSGRSLYATLRLLHEAGSRPRRADAWAIKSLSIVLTGDAVLGRLTRKGTPVLDSNGVPVTPWAGILALEEVERLRAELAAKPLGQRRRRASRLLSGLLTCASCHGRLRVNVSGNVRRKQVRYVCHGRSDGRGCAAPIYILCELTETYVSDLYLSAFSDTPYVRREVLSPEPGSLVDIEREIRDVAAAMTHDDADIVRLSERLATLKAERRDTRSTPAAPMVRLIATGQTHRQVWELAGIEDRRAMIAAVYPVIRIGPGVKGRRGMDPSRVTIIAAPPLVLGGANPLAFRENRPTISGILDPQTAAQEAAWDARQDAAEAAGGAVLDAYAAAMRGEDSAAVRALSAAFSAGPAAWAEYVASNGS